MKKMHNTPHPILIFAQLLKAHKRKMVILILLQMFIGISPSVDGIVLKNIIDNAEKYIGDELISKMFFLGIVYFIWMETLNFTYRAYDYVYLQTMPKLKGNVIQYFYGHIQKHNHEFFQNEMAGNISNRIMDTTKALEYFLSNVAEKIIKKSVSIITALITIYFVNSVFATIFAIWLVLFCGFSIFFSPDINRFSSYLASTRSTVSGRIVDAISNISAIRMFSTYLYENKYLKHYIDLFIKSDMNLQWFMLKIRYVLGLLCSIMTFCMIYHLSQLRSQNVITIGDFGLILSVCNSIAQDIWDLSEEIGDTFEDYGSFKQSSLLLLPHSMQDSGTNKLVVDKGEIKFCNIIFKYKNQDTLFNDKSIFIPGKQKVGLVGYSGSGKTSFVNLINRLYDVDSGEIFIDDQDIAKVTQESLRNAISFIPQDPILFHRSVKENIKYGKLDADDDEVVEAAKKAHIHDVIMSMADKYDSLCGEKGNKLSGGQRQRIAIARAILKNAPLLILDEATSSLDTLTERLIQDSLSLLMQDKTVIVIAHRLSTLLSMDRILVFDNGRIVEDGTHIELLAQNGLYQKLWNSQVEGFIS
jgi:ATP-binding cassette subfamily B protein